MQRKVNKVKKKYSNKKHIQSERLGDDLSFGTNGQGKRSSSKNIKINPPSKRKVEDVTLSQGYKRLKKFNTGNQDSSKYSINNL